MNAADPRTPRKVSTSGSSQKARGTCSVCHVSRQLHLKDGRVHLHGSRADPCPGSNKPPLAESQPDLVTSKSHQPTTTKNTNPNMSQTDGTANVKCKAAPTIDYSKHPSLQFKLMRHIPKGARNCTGLLLTSIINQLTSDPMQLDNWRCLLSFGAVILLS